MENEIFYCYSKPLKNFLVQNGLRYIAKSNHEKTKKKFWVFLGTKELNIKLDEWNLRRG